MSESSALDLPGSAANTVTIVTETNEVGEQQIRVTITINETTTGIEAQLQTLLLHELLILNNGYKPDVAKFLGISLKTLYNRLGAEKKPEK